MSWIDCPALSFEIFTAGFDLNSRRFTVPWWSALDHISNVDPLAIQSGLTEFEVE